MKKYITVFLLLWLTCWCAMAQQLSVSSFKCMPTDLDARVTYPVRDHNGKTCALIKVENINTGFQFATGTLSIPKVEQKSGEIWVYVQPGVQKMTISHSSLGVLRDYRFPESIKEATVYVMKLESGSVHTYVEQAPTGGYLVMHLTPANAVVWVDENLQTTNEGGVMIYLKNGVHSYRVQAEGYSQEVGKFEISGTRKDMTVALQSNKAHLSITSVDPKSDLYIDDKRMGAGQWKGDVLPGMHIVEVKRDGHRSQRREVDLSERETSEIHFDALTPINGKLQVGSYPIDTEVWLDGMKVGTTPYGPENVLIGIHQLELRKTGYESLKRNVVISEGETYMVNNSLEKEAPKRKTVSVTQPIKSQSSLLSEPKSRKYLQLYLSYENMHTAEPNYEELTFHGATLLGVAYGIRLGKKSPFFFETGCSIFLGGGEYDYYETSYNGYYNSYTGEYNDYSYDYSSSDAVLIGALTIPANLVCRWDYRKGFVSLSGGLNVRLSIDDIYVEEDIDEADGRCTYGWQCGATIGFKSGFYIGLGYASDLNEYREGWRFDTISARIGWDF